MKSNDNSIFEKNFLPCDLLNDISELPKSNNSDSDDSESDIQYKLQDALIIDPALIINAHSSSSDGKRRSFNNDFNGLQNFQSYFDKEVHKFNEANKYGMSLNAPFRVMKPPKAKNFSHQNLTGKHFLPQARINMPFTNGYTPVILRNSLDKLNSSNSANSNDPYVNVNMIKNSNYANSEKLVNYYDGYNNYGPVEQRSNMNMNINNLPNNYNDDLILKLQNMDMKMKPYPFHRLKYSAKNLNTLNKKNNISCNNLPKRNYSAGLSNHLVSNIICESLIEENEEDLQVFLDKIGENLIPFIKTQRGSRFLQKFMNKFMPEVLDKLLQLLSPNFKEIMNDNYGNYLMQKLMQTCSKQQRLYFIGSVY
jgi:hypothetical protein